MNRILKNIVKTLHCNVSTALMLLMLYCFQPAFATPTTPTSDFIDNGDGTVTHNKTGLIWMRCAMGQVWDTTTSSCRGSATTYNWNEAMILKSSFAGENDWRLPNMAELHSIIEQENMNPTINMTIFPNTSNDWVWSSSLCSYDATYVWVLYLGDGHDDQASKDKAYTIRMVRGNS